MRQVAVSKYSLGGGDWGVMSSARANDLARTANEMPLLGNSPERFGLTNCRVILEPKVVIYGYFVQEFVRPRIELSDDKTEQVITGEDTEKYIIAISPNDGLVGMQVKRSKYAPKRDVLEERFMDSLLGTFEANGLRFDAMDMLSYGPTREELIHLFYSATDTARVTYIHFGRFSRSLPNDFKFFNPREDWDAVMRSIIGITADNATSTTYVASSTGDVRRIPEVRGGIHLANDIYALERETTHGDREVYKAEVAISVSVSDQALDERVSEEDARALLRALLQQSSMVPTRQTGRRRKLQRRNQVSPYTQERLLDDTN